MDTYTITRETDDRAGIQWLECDSCGEQSAPLALYEADLNAGSHVCYGCEADGFVKAVA